VSGQLTIVRPGLPVPPSKPGDDTMAFDEFRAWLTSGRAIGHLGRYREARIMVHRLEMAGRPLPLALALRGLSRGAILLEDADGHRRRISTRQVLGWLAAYAVEPFRVGALLRRVERDLAALESAARVPRPLDLSRPPMYLRSDLSAGVRAGGSVGHIAGVLNSLDAFTAPPIFVTTDDVPTVRDDVERHFVMAPEAFWNFKELPALVLNGAVEETADRAIAGRPLSFVYQRYSLNNYAGIRVARSHHVPLIIEYNGSEIWMSRHWGHPLKYEALSERIERLVLASADLIVVVSRAMEDELIARGFDRSRIFVNVNGVDETRYRPDVDGRAVREREDLGGKIVIGFIGTFGPWHGADVLARAFVTLCRQDPAVAAPLRLLMIGDGAGAAAARRITADAGVDDRVVWTGLVPQSAGPEYLAACDVLVSPHVPNPDGSPFFGSPTKLFEYMAMGKGIVASNLDQIGDVLTHDRTAWLVAPGDADALAAAMDRLVSDPRLRERLGAEARCEVLAHHTWRQHTRRTIERLREVADASPGERG
jgi:glycosyltransferase involved in cell wall biosynthesis